MSQSLPSKPKLRRLHRIEMAREDERLLVLEDPLRLAQPFAIDLELAPVLDMLDGQKTLAQIRQSLLMRGLFDLDADSLKIFAEELEHGGMLEGEEFERQWTAEVRAFERAPKRRAREHDRLYPAADELTCRPERTRAGSRVTGLVLPYHPWSRASSLYDSTLRDLPPAEELDLIVWLGTDHGPGLTPYVLTEKHYATPHGTLETDVALVRELEADHPWLTREELRHRVAPSLEMAAFATHLAYPKACPKILPVLCGRTATQEGPWPDEFHSALERALMGRRALLWCHAELSHAGPAFGRSDAGPAASETAQSTATMMAQAEAADLHRIESLRRGHVRRFLELCDLDREDPTRPSGAAALSTFMRLLPVEKSVSHCEYQSVPAPGAQPGRSGLLGLRVESRQ